MTGLWGPNLSLFGVGEQGRATFLSMPSLPSVPRFYLDIHDGDQASKDLDGIDFADLKTAVAEVVQGARYLWRMGSSGMRMCRGTPL